MNPPAAGGNGKSNRIMATGGAGFLGSHLCDRLLTARSGPCQTGHRRERDGKRQESVSLGLGHGRDPFGGCEGGAGRAPRLDRFLVTKPSILRMATSSSSLETHG